MGGVSPLEGDVALGESDQPAVGDGDAMGVGAQIAQHMFRPSEGPLGVDDPVMAEQYPQPCCKGTRLGQGQEVAVEMECAFAESSLQGSDELAAEDTAEHADGQEEGAPGGDPAGVIRRQTTGGQYAVDMGMKLQALIPAVEHAEEAYLGSKVPGIAGDLQQSFGAGVKQQVVDQSLVLQCERSKFPRECEDDMDIVGGQQFPFPRLEPAQADVALAARAMAVSARVVRDGSMSAVRGLIAMSTQRGGAAARDG